ncbi:hypothetical protein ACS0TY_029298 [Phlomoides rotata]
MSSQTCIPFIFLIITNFSALVLSADYGCFGNNYTVNSTYATNLNTLFSSLTSKIGDAGFYNASEGQISGDRAYVAVLCRTDYQLDTCRSCVQNSTTELLGLCPTRKQGVLFNYICTLRYSDESMFRIRSSSYWITTKYPTTVSNPAQFNQDLRSLLADLRGQAALGGSAVKIAAGNRRAPNFQTIFALLQCMPDLSSDDCISCLIAAEERICCENWTRVIIYVPSCTLEYNTQPFYNMTRIEQVRAMVSVPVPAPVPIPVSVPVPPTPLSPGNGNGSKTPTVTIILVSVVASLLLVACVGCYYLRKRLKKSKHINIQREDDDEKSPTESLRYDFVAIKAATNDFSDTNKLGEGGFGSVYKGKLENGQKIAVKRLSRSSGQGDLEFKNEVMLMAKLQHRNLVRLLGFSLEGSERLLIYELIQNSSLDTFIFDPVRRLLIDWDARYKIIKGIARGLLYLHEDSSLHIIHRDLKASNILLDGGMTPKIADFGMARLFMQDESKGNTRRIVGTYGYMPPEYARHGEFSVKLDVFSFGVLVLEIVSGQNNYSFQNEEDMEYLISFAWKNWRDGTTKKIIDPVLMSTCGSFRDMLRCMHIGLLCVQENAIKRPTMAFVVLMLSSYSITLPVPSQPAYFIPRPSTSPSDSRHTKLSKPISKNDVSLSELYPR